MRPSISPAKARAAYVVARAYLWVQIVYMCGALGVRTVFEPWTEVEKDSRGLWRMQ